MKTIDQIKDCQAIELGYNSFRDLVFNPKQDMKINHLNWCIEESMKEYAVQVASKSLLCAYEKIINDFVWNTDIGKTCYLSILNTKIELP